MRADAPMPNRLSLAELGRLDRETFVRMLGGIFEHSPWVAEGSWERRPFADLDGLHRAMVEVMRGAGRERQLVLIRAHPELAGAAARRGDLTEASRQEQGSAGLATADDEELARFRALNEAYRGTFGFPFIMAVKGRSRAEILAAFEERLQHTPEAEFERALDEIARIARLRLDALFGA